MHINLSPPLKMRWATLFWIWAGFPAIGLAQHSDVFAYRDAQSQLVTFADGATARVFARRFDFFGHPFGNTSLPKVFFADDPGFQSNAIAPAGFATLPVGEVIGLNFVPFFLPNGVAGNVVHWDANDLEVEFAAFPASYTFALEDGAGNAGGILTGSTQRVDNVLIGSIDGTLGLHQHIEWSLSDNDGTAETDPATGIYVMAAELAMTGLETSAPFFIVLTSPTVSNASQSAAAMWLQQNLQEITFGDAPLLGDFDEDHLLTIEDLDLLVSAVAGDDDDGRFDITGDGGVDTDDVQYWRAVAGAANLPSGNSYLEGDANLDGVVDVSDFNIWNSNKFESLAKWSAGDFSADGAIDVSDFNIWNSRKFQNAGVSALPEPSPWAGGLTAVAVVIACRRGRRRVPD